MPSVHHFLYLTDKMGIKLVPISCVIRVYKSFVSTVLIIAINKIIFCSVGFWWYHILECSFSDFMLSTLSAVIISHWFSHSVFRNYTPRMDQALLHTVLMFPLLWIFQEYKIILFYLLFLYTLGLGMFFCDLIILTMFPSSFENPIFLF